MKKALVNALKVLVPLAVGVSVKIHKQYSDLSTAQRAELFTAFRAADLAGWLLQL